MTSSRIPEKIAADHIRELVQGFTTTETITQPILHPDGRWRPTRRLHTVTHPPLLDQIEQTVTGTTTGGQVYHSAYGSKPAGRLDCLAYLHRLDHQSRDLATRHHIEPDQPLRNRLLGLSAAIGDRPHHQVKSWWATARVLTQHDSPPFAPNVPCPECDMRGSLRVRFDPKVATCVECHGVWDEDEGRFGRLALWCEWAGEHLNGARHLLGRARADELGVEHGYDEALGYVVVCPDCEFERQAMAEREAARLRAPRAYAGVSAEAGRMAS